MNVREWKSAQEMQNTPTDVQRKLAQVLYAGSLRPIVNQGAKTAWCQETGVLCQRLYASSPLLQLGQHGNVQGCIKQTAQLSTFARVCRAWHEELQLCKQERVAALVARFVKISIPQALELMNISNYDPVSLIALLMCWRVLFLFDMMSVNIHL